VCLYYLFLNQGQDRLKIPLLSRSLSALITRRIYSMSLDQNLRRISPATLKLWIDSLEPSTLAIVDVRDGDHVGVSTS
jgi:hypothetical protein